MTSANPFALGTADWGTTLAGDALDRLYATYRAAGGTHFDSAHVYAAWRPGGDGMSERTLGDVVRRHGDRAHVTIATKGGHPAFNGYPRPDDYLSPRQLASDVRDSLDRLGVESIDLYFLHRDDARVPVAEMVDALHEHVAAGRLKRLGVSNWSIARLVEANAYARAKGRTPFTASQPKFSLAVPKPSTDPLVPDFGDAEIAWHAANPAIEIWAYSPTAGGLFATGSVKGGWSTDATAHRLARAQALAAELGATPNQVALAWLLARPFPTRPILGTKDVGHLRDALGAARLSTGQVDALAAN